MKRLLAISCLGLLTACKVGPCYHQPNAPIPAVFSEATENIESNDSLVQWWQIFNDPLLNCILDEAVAGSFDYRIALEQVYLARAQYWIQFAQILPAFVYDAQGSRFRSSQSFPSRGTLPINPVQSFFQMGFDAIWEIDLFGKLRRSADAAYDTWEATAADARNVRIIVLSEVANTYVLIRNYQAQLRLSEKILAIDENFLNLTTARFEAGLATAQEVESTRANFETDKATIKTYETLLKQSIYSLGVLLGQPPEHFEHTFDAEASVPYASGKIPVGLPGDLLRRRHDIHSAERQLASAVELVGVAIAELFPTISLTGSSSSFAANPLQGANVGFSSDDASTLLTSPSRIWGIGALLTWPVFNFGKLQAGVDAQWFYEHQAYLNYQKTVITALQEVEQALVAYYNEEKRVTDLDNAATASQKALDLATDLYEAGLTDYTTVLQSRQIWVNAMTSLTNSQQALSSNLIAVYKALGGDW